eukprot:612929-Pyramimonas_sp.AAC.1
MTVGWCELLAVLVVMVATDVAAGAASAAVAVGIDVGLVRIVMALVDGGTRRGGGAADLLRHPRIGS